MRYRANEVLWEIIMIKNKLCFFCNLRIDRNSIPNSFNMYEVADEDCNGTPCYLSKGILVNFYGTIITKDIIKFDDRYCYIDSNEWISQSSKFYKLSEIINLFKRGEN